MCAVKLGLRAHAVEWMIELNCPFVTGVLPEFVMMALRAVNADCKLVLIGFPTQLFSSQPNYAIECPKSGNLFRFTALWIDLVREKRYKEFFGNLCFPEWAHYHSPWLCRVQINDGSFWWGNLRRSRRKLSWIGFPPSYVTQLLSKALILVLLGNCFFTFPHCWVPVSNQFSY